MAGDTTSAERMQRYRWRHQRGLRVVTLEVGPMIVDALVRQGWLSAADAQDRQALAAALMALIKSGCAIHRCMEVIE